MTKLNLFQFLGVVALICCAAMPSHAEQRTPVIVTAYPIAPFLTTGGTGPLPELLDLFNGLQDQYRYELRITSANRRYDEVLNKGAHMVPFEMMDWGWARHSHTVRPTKPLLYGGEVYVARQQDERSQSFFENINSKSIVGVLGYHYGFAGFNSDRNYLESNYDIQFGDTYTSNLKLVQHGRADLTIVSDFFLSVYFNRNPQLNKIFLVSERIDNRTDLPFLLANHSPITMEQFQSFLDGLISSGLLEEFFQSRGLAGHVRSVGN